MTSKEKLHMRARLALVILNLIEQNKTTDRIASITSLRKLAAASQLEYSIVQRITTLKKDPQFTTVCSLAEGFTLNAGVFLSSLDSVTEEEVLVFLRKIKRTGRNSGNKKEC